MADDSKKITAFPSSGAGGGGQTAPLPAGKLEMIITYLEMTSPPTPRTPMHRAEPISIIRARRPTVSYYRYLYDAVGAPWMWFERKVLDDSSLAAIIQDPRVSVYVMYTDGVPAGYVELDARVAGEVEIAYFGLLPEFIGRGLGRYLLEWTVDTAFSQELSRLWVHTCNHDHPGALANYQRCGFQPYRQERQVIDDPRPGLS
jgi:GNAT superfamily N-acetyltransferase